MAALSLFATGCLTTQPPLPPAVTRPAAPPPATAVAPTGPVVQAQAVAPKLPPLPTQADPPPPPPDAPAISGSTRSVGGPLTVEEVLASVEQHYPLLRAIEQERAIAGGRLVTATGAFDLNLLAGVDGQGTTYDNVRHTVGVSQGLPFGGVGLTAGYRGGYGDFPTYNLGSKTADGGEFRAAATLPLLRDREIDRPRASIQQARIDTQIAEPVIERQRLDFYRAAARTYWNWVAAGQRLKIVNDLVKLAADRDAQLKARVLGGPQAAIDRVDNQQNIALRNGVQVQAERAYQQATIDLSLFLRDTAGTPSLAGTDRLPAFPDVRPVDVSVFDQSLQTAFELRPEPRRLRLQRDRVGVDLALALNQTLPQLNATLGAAQDVGPGKSSLSGPNGLEKTTVAAGLAYALPLQRRDARGRIVTAQAQMAQFDQQIRQTEDVIRAEVQDAFSALERAYAFYQQAVNRVELARTVAEAERVLFREGRSDILRVTLRETAAFDAEIVEIGARQDYFRALWDLQFVTGVGGKR